MKYLNPAVTHVCRRGDRYVPVPQVLKEILRAAGRVDSYRRGNQYLVPVPQALKEVLRIAGSVVGRMAVYRNKATEVRESENSDGTLVRNVGNDWLA